MKTPVRWTLIAVALSGWIFSGIIYVNFKTKLAKTQTEIATIESEIQAYSLLADDIEKSVGQIGEIIRTLETLKSNLEGIRNKMERRDKDESSKNRE